MLIITCLRRNMDLFVTVCTPCTQTLNRTVVRRRKKSLGSARLCDARMPITTSFELSQQKIAEIARLAPPTFTTLWDPRKGPDAMNQPLSARVDRLPNTAVNNMPAMRPAFTISDAALSRLLAPPEGRSTGTSSNQPLVDELAQIARTRLSAADVLKLRDQLTAILETASGAPAAAVTAVRLSLIHI